MSHSPSTEYRVLKRVIGSLVSILLGLFLIKYAVYSEYLTHSCRFRPLVLMWKDVKMCADTRDVFLWNAIDIILVLCAAALFIAIAYGFWRERKGGE